MTDFTERFTGRAESYSKYRPRYPQGIIPALNLEVGFNREMVVADVGSGTGILSELFLKNGNVVYGVEPNVDMKRVAEMRLAPRFPRLFRSVRGKAERTTLGTSSVDLVAVGQALHWFDLPDARREFARILRPGGYVCVLYNERAPGKGLMAAYGRVVASFHEKMPKGVLDIDDATLKRLFSSYKTLTFPNRQSLDLEGLLGRLLSSSYAPSPGDTAGTRKVERTIRRIFSRYSSDGKVTVRYVTRVYLGTLKRPVSSPRTAA